MIIKLTTVKLPASDSFNKQSGEIMKSTGHVEIVCCRDAILQKYLSLWPLVDKFSILDRSPKDNIGEDTLGSIKKCCSCVLQKSLQRRFPNHRFMLTPGNTD